MDISSYPLHFQVLIFLSTFANPAKQLLEPFFDSNHPIYRQPDLGQCLKLVKELFCSPFQRQALKRHFDNFKLKDHNYRVFLSKKLDIYLATMDIYSIPSWPHNPPITHNKLFEDFKLAFIDSISSDFEFCKDVSKVSVQLQTLQSLQYFVENQEKTLQMMQSSIKQKQQIKSQNQVTKNGQNGKFVRPSDKNSNIGQKKSPPKPIQQKSAANTFSQKFQNQTQKNPSTGALTQKNPSKNNNKKIENRPSCSRCSHFSHRVKDCHATRHRDGSILPALAKKGGNSARRGGANLSKPAVRQLSELDFEYDNFVEQLETCQVTENLQLNNFGSVRQLTELHCISPVNTNDFLGPSDIDIHSSYDLVLV